MNFKSQFIETTLVRQWQGFAADPAIRGGTGQQLVKTLKLWTAIGLAGKVH
jgi:hypothetical protein